MISNNIIKAIKLKLDDLNICNMDFIVEKTKNVKFGDYSSNVAMVLSKRLKKSPVEIAHSLRDSLINDSQFKKIEVSNAGFLNFWLSNDVKTQIIKEILIKGDDFGKFDKKLTNYSVEYVSANPTGLLHIGHARNAILGNCLISILEWFGYNTVSEYIINDAGNQMNNLATAVLIRYLQLSGNPITLPADSYHGVEIIQVAKLLKTTYGNLFINDKLDENNLNINKDHEFIIRWFARGVLLEIIKQDLHDLGVDIQYYYSEYDIHNSGLIDKTIDELKQKNVAYVKDGATWLKTTNYGDDKDRVLIKSDGVPTYFMPDIVYHRHKFNTNNTDVLVNIWGADHYSYITRMSAAMQALGFAKEKLIIISMQMVRLLKDGQEFKMSKRTGNSLTTRDLTKALGKDAARWFLICQSASNHLEIDVDVATNKSSNNPLYYVQYAYARANQLLNKKLLSMPLTFDNLNSEMERDIISELCYFQYTIQNCAETYEPYKMTVYLSNLAKLFHAYYSSTKIYDDTNQFANEKYYLIKAIKQVIKNGLTILGISTPEKM